MPQPGQAPGPPEMSVLDLTINCRINSSEAWQKVLI
jgi:hypothetical protein